MGGLTASLKPALDAAAAAQTTANTGVANAATAQTTANTGVTNAATAQTTANTGVTNAATAQTTANGKVALDCGHGAVGSFCFAYKAAAVTAGATYAGSGLFVGAMYDSYGVWLGSGGSALTGTWRALGYCGTAGSVTLYQRIA